MEIYIFCLIQNFFKKIILEMNYFKSFFFFVILVAFTLLTDIFSSMLKISQKARATLELKQFNHKMF